MAAMQSVLCLCPDDAHPPGNHMGPNLESLAAIEDEIWDSNYIITSSQLLFLSLDDILRTLGVDVVPPSTLEVSEENLNFEYTDDDFDFFDECPAAEDEVGIEC